MTMKLLQYHPNKIANFQKKKVYFNTIQNLNLNQIGISRWMETFYKLIQFEKL